MPFLVASLFFQKETFIKETIITARGTPPEHELYIHTTTPSWN